MLTKRSKIAIRWTTNPADFGYEGKKSNWLNSAPLICGVRRASRIYDELARRYGQGVYIAIDCRHNGIPVTQDHIWAIANQP